MNANKLLTGYLAVLTYGASYMFLVAGYPVATLYVALFASSAAIGLIVVEWSQA